jgi:hypothetical protein
MNNIRYFAMIFGIIFLLVGIAGFIPPLVQPGMGDYHLTVDGPGQGYLFGLFHVNLLHNLIHLVFGLWGIIAAVSTDASRVYSRSVAVIYGILVIMGLIPVLNTVFGLVPIHGNDVWLHAIIAIVAAYFGWATVSTPVVTTGPTGATGTTEDYRG